MDGNPQIPSRAQPPVKSGLTTRSETKRNNLDLRGISGLDDGGRTKELLRHNGDISLRGFCYCQGGPHSFGSESDFAWGSYREQERVAPGERTAFSLSGQSLFSRLYRLRANRSP